MVELCVLHYVLWPLLFFIGLVSTLVFLQFYSKKYDHLPNLPKGSMGWPFVGETLQFLNPHPPNSLGGFLQQHCSKYGKVFKSNLFGCPTIVSLDHDLNLFILQNEEKLFLASYPKAMHGILGKFSLLIVSGDMHKKLRSHVVKFSSTCKSNPDYLHYIERLSLSMMESWKGCNEIYFHREARKFLFNLTVKQVLSIEQEDPLSTKILEDFLTFMKGFVSLPLNIPGTPYFKAVKARERISTILKDIMRQRRAKGECKKGDFFDTLLSNESLNDEERVSIVMDILLGGYETTSTLLSLILFFVGHSPNVLEQLKEEHEEIRKSKGEGEALKWDDYKKMSFTSFVICEALRCGNVVKFVHREALQDVTFKGYKVPGGWKVLPILTGAHLDASLHENPYHFDPCRWADPKTNKKMEAFGGGPRLCPGMDLAKVESAFFLHHFVLSFRWKVKEDFPLAYPYVDFQRGLPLLLQPLHVK